MIEQNNNELVLRAAWLYYVEKMKQEEVAGKLNVSRMKVVRLLKEAHEKGLIELRIHSKRISLMTMEKRVKEATGLQDVFIVPSGKNEINSVANGMAYCFEQAARRYEYIGIGEGRTLNKFAEYLIPIRDTAVKSVVSLTGTMCASRAINPGNVIYTLAQKIKADCFNIAAPFIVQSKEEAETLKSHFSIEPILKKGSRLQAAFIGVGDIVNSTFALRGDLTQKEIDSVLEEGAVGEILGYFFTESGEQVGKHITERTVGISLPASCPITAAAGGTEKVRALTAVIRSGYISGLITDENTAEAILNKGGVVSAKAEN